MPRGYHHLTVFAIKRMKEHLKESWSPKQISGRLKMEDIHIGYESIYQHVWTDKRVGGDLYKNLRHVGRKYYKRISEKSGRGFISNWVDIKELPNIVEAKSRIGD